MVALAGGARFVDEALQQRWGFGNISRHELYGDALAKDDMGRLVDRPHAACADLADDAIAVDDLASGDGGRHLRDSLGGEGKAVYHTRPHRGIRCAASITGSWLVSS